MKKRDPSDPACAARSKPSRGAAFAEQALLFDHLTDDAWDDGTPRQRSTLTVFADGGTWKVALNDRDEGLTAFVTAESLEACFEDLEEGLVSGSLPWRASVYGRGKPPAKRG